MLNVLIFHARFCHDEEQLCFLEYVKIQIFPLRAKKNYDKQTTEKKKKHVLTSPLCLLELFSFHEKTVGVEFLTIEITKSTKYNPLHMVIFTKSF